MIQKLAETVSDLYVCESPSTAEKLWASAAKVLAKTPADPARAAEIVRNRDVVALATLVGEITAAKPGTITGKSPTPPAAAATTASAPASAPGVATPPADPRFTRPRSQSDDLSRRRAFARHPQVRSQGLSQADQADPAR